MKKIVCLGAGLVARPYIQYLSDNGFNIIVASRTISKAEHLIEGCKNTEAVTFNIAKDDNLLEELTKKADLVCSLLPYTYHVKAAKVAIRHKTHFCTTSYISNEMKALDDNARKAGILLLNECGVDPGIDHMSAMKIIDEVHNNNGKIVSFTSFTGGLPAPDSNNNPYGYKLSWSPRGVLLAGRNDAKFLRDGKEINIPGPELFENCELMEVPGIGTFEGYPNRDSLSYIDIYNIPETKTMLRGTFRNVGWCSTLDKIADLGLLNLEERSLEGLTYADLLKELTSSSDSNIKSTIAKICNIAPNDPIIRRLEWLGLFKEEKIPSGTNTILDALCNLFEEKLQYSPGERDMIVMHHEFLVQYPDKQQRITSTLIDYGIPNGDSSMSRTVALPVAIASKMILNEKITLTGVHRPIIPEIYEPILKELETLNITMDEKTFDL
ncbi:MAG: saccharopine dehydrogenase [Candidatus Thorarchaeota archaeon SMTZ-45]|nr:MAG: saccharopine dehydrogenase [Candidatus Thorarchaeota archaeon SMTZ1-45]KXH76698.1 MAG: saccharopine dehydrogenase [Candidatus Thorarchaeota archaeon SMTZ-45]